jgi:hypothetical protein
MSYKKRQQSYITRRSEHHTQTNPEQTQNTPNKHTTILNPMGEKIETSRWILRRRCQR